MRKIQCQRVVLDQPAAEDRAEDRAEQHRHAEDGHQAAHPGRAGRAGHDRHAERHEHAAAEALQGAEADEQPIVVAIAQSTEPSVKSSSAVM